MFHPKWLVASLKRRRVGKVPTMFRDSEITWDEILKTPDRYNVVQAIHAGK